MSARPQAHSVDRPAEADIRLLHASVLVVFVAAVIGLAPGPVGTGASVTAVAVAIAAPVLRVVRLAVRWAADGDARFALAAASLVSLVLAGAVIAVVTA